MILASHRDLSTAAGALADEVIAALRQGLAARGVASLAVPGGRTPVPLFRALREAVVDWARVCVTLTDERRVPESDPASNAALVRAELLQGPAAAARFLPLHDGSSNAEGAAQDVWRLLQDMHWPLDAVVLGMGEDGHFASLFPGNPGLAQALDPAGVPGCVAMQAPVPPQERMSLNLAALRQARRLFLLVGGAAKYRLLLQAAREGNASQWPVGALLALRNPVPEVYWAP